MKTNLMPAIDLFLTFLLDYFKFSNADYLQTREPISNPMWSGILLSTTSWRQTLARIYKKHVGAYGDNGPIGYNSPRGVKTWERYDDEALEYPNYDDPPMNWIIRSKYQKLKNNMSSRHEFLPRNRKQLLTTLSTSSDVAQFSTTKRLPGTKIAEVVKKEVAATTTKTTKQNLISKMITRKDLQQDLLSVISTISSSRRKTFTEIRTLHGLIIKKTFYEEILEDHDQESILSYAMMATLLLLLFLAIFLYFGSKNKMKHKICGRKLQNRRHTLMEVVASTKLMGPTNHRESGFLKGDSCLTSDLKRSSRKKKLSEISEDEEKHLVCAADDSEEEFSLLVPVNKVKEFRHAEA